MSEEPATAEADDSLASLKEVRGHHIGINLLVGLWGLVAFAVRFAIHPEFPPAIDTSLHDALDWSAWLDLIRKELMWTIWGAAELYLLWTFRRTAFLTDQIAFALNITCIVASMWSVYARHFLNITDIYTVWPIRSTMFVAAALLLMYGRSRDKQSDTG